jgi:hypothetical protein
MTIGCCAKALRGTADRVQATTPNSSLDNFILSPPGVLCLKLGDARLAEANITKKTCRAYCGNPQVRREADRHSPLRRLTPHCLLAGELR